MRRSAVVLLLLCAVSPSRAVAQVRATIGGPASPNAQLEAGGGVCPAGEICGVYAEGYPGVHAHSNEGTALVAKGYYFGVDASGGLYGARLSTEYGSAAQLQLVPGSAVGPRGPGWGADEAGAFYVDANGTLWFCTVGGTPGTWVALNRQGPPPGAIISYAGATPPSGYLLCNGQAVSRVTYAALFSNIGTTYGAGDGSTTFNVPDLRGEFLRGLDGGRGVDAGRTLGSAQAANIAPHSHPFGGGTNNFNQSIQITLSMGGHFVPATGSVNNAGNTGNNAGTETRPRNVAVNYLIAF